LSDPVPALPSFAAPKRNVEGAAGRLSREAGMIGDRLRRRLGRNLALSPAGDVLAAHELATWLLGSFGAPAPAARDARLLLTASVLHLQARADRSPAARDLLELLVGFASGVCAAHVFAASPMQVLQFAGAEFAMLDPPDRLAALRLSLRAVGRAMSPGHHLC
jgi:hypothetical protein